MIISSPQTPKGGLKKKIKNLLKPITKKKEQSFLFSNANIVEFFLNDKFQPKQI